MHPLPCSYRSASTTAPYSCCSLYGNPSLIDLDYSASNTENTNRFDWRTRAPIRTLTETAKDKGRRRDLVKRVAPQHHQLERDERFYSKVNAYSRRFVPLLDAERAADEEVLRERLSSWSLEKLKKEGYCITDLSAYWHDGKLYGRPLASFTLGPGIALPPEHRFEKGTQVLVTHLDPLKEEPQRGSVVRCDDTRLQVVFDEWFMLGQEPWRLDVGRSDIVYARMKEAITRLHCDPAIQEAQGENARDSQNLLQGTYLRDILLRSTVFEPNDDVPDGEAALDAPAIDASVAAISDDATIELAGLFKDDACISSWAARYSQPNPVAVEGDPVLENLNPTQVRAVAMMLNNRLCLVQGPPGTGKTKTIVETVKLLKRHFRVPFPVLLCTFTNVAVDNLVEGIVASSLRPLRVGSSGKVKRSLQEYTVEEQLLKHPLWPKLEQTRQKQEYIAKDIVELVRKIKAEEKTARRNNMEVHLLCLEREEKIYKAKAYAIYIQMLSDVVQSADVVCTTCISSASKHLSVIDFPIVLVDEASMSTEPATLVPLMKGSRHAALIGDHKQLPPVITSDEAKTKGLGISLFERLSDERLVPSIMLDIQYRMHPNIAQFPSDEFYNKTIRDGTVNDAGHVAPHLFPPHSTIFPQLARSHEGVRSKHKPSVVFLDHVGEESLKDRSRVNRDEAKIVCSLVEDLLLHNPHMRASDIGIIAPYVAQITLLTRLFTTDAKTLARFNAVLGPRAAELSNIEIKTVDGFEGREKDVIIFSTVRNNSTGHIGFLADRRRLNVGLTRAKRGLFIVGSISTLKKSTNTNNPALGILTVGAGRHAWRRYAEFLMREKLIINLQGEALQRALYSNVVSQAGPKRWLA